MKDKFIVISILMLVLLGCESDKVVVEVVYPEVEAEYNVHFTDVPESISHPPNIAPEIYIDVVVRKKNGDPGDSVRVEFYETTGLGSFLTNDVTTNAFGEASGLLRLHPNKFHTCKIFVLVPGGRADAEFQVRPVAMPARIRVIGIPNPIYVQPGGNAIVSYGVIVTDSNHVGVPGCRIRTWLSSNPGRMTFGVLTDSTFSTLGAFGRQWLVVSAEIDEPAFQLQDSVEINVQRLSPVEIGSITIRAFPNFLNIPNDLTGGVEIRVQIRDINNIGIPGLIIDATTDLGTIEPTDTTGENGVAIIGITFQPGESGIAHVLISIRGTEYETVLEIRVNRIPGPPANIDLSIDPDTTFAGSSEPINATAVVTDRLGYPVAPGTLVRFSGNLGDIISSSLTDAEGKAYARLSFNRNEAGLVFIRAIAGEISDTDTLYVLSNSSPRRIMLGADNASVPVEEDLILTATVFGFGEAPVDPPVTVVFRALNVDPFAGAHFPNGQASDSAQTDENGEARIVLNAGRQIGGLLLKCYTWTDPETRLDTLWSPVMSIVQVVAGKPAAIDIDVNSDGEDVGGGMWRIPVSARVFDRYLNPVTDADVVFSVSPENVAEIVPGRQGEAWIVYHGIRTFDPITITASVHTGNGLVTASREWMLPLQDGSLTLTVDPQNWMFDRERPNDTCTIQVRAVLTDGQGLAVNNAPILFRTDRARFFWRDAMTGRYVMFYPEAARKYTGVIDQHHNEARGTATVYLRGVMWDGFLDDFSLEVTVHIEASVEGYDVAADPAFVFFTRH